MRTPSGINFFAFLSMILLAALVSGCGSGSTPGGVTTPGAADSALTDGAIDFSQVSFTASPPDKATLLSGVQAVGTPVCAGCHAMAGSPIQALRSKKSFDNAPGNTSWLYGPHGNYESLNMTTFQFEDRGKDNTGVPFYGLEGFGTDPNCLTNCHDPLGEGRNIAAAYAATGNDKIGRVDRPIIGCEACHGGGQNHFGTAALPVARPNALRCGRCHNKAFPDGHLTYHPEGSGVFEDYLASGHSRSMSGAGYAAGASVPAVCGRCHTDEGAQSLVTAINGTESYSAITQAAATQSDVPNGSAVQCRTCHDKHNPDTLLGTKASGLPSSWSDEFKTCNSCHQLLKTDNTRNIAAFHDPAVNTTTGSPDRIITDTHFDDPATPEIEGYVVDPSSSHKGTAGNTNSGTCRDCHNPHKANVEINRQWARSAHGGFIAITNPVTDGAAPAWAHYDFKATNRQDCQRCHTSTGFRNMANNPAGYDPSKNQFTATGNQKEMLYCWACHTSNTGNLRNPGAFVMPPSYAMPAGRSIPANASGSLICLNCHSGRETGQFIKNNYTDAKIVGMNFGSFNSHYLAAGGILYRTVGYEFGGKDYSNGSDFKHDVIGLVVDGTGTNGPCVGCHMESAESHLFEAATKDGSGSVTEIPALGNVCAKCHGVITETMSPAVLNSLENGFNSSMGVLQDLLAKKGIWYNKAAHPYFYDSPSFANPFTAWPNMDTLGAAFNLNLLEHQPGAFAHNSRYTRRLLYDSIDIADDGFLNDSVAATLNTLPSGGAYKQGAIQFLTGSGGRP